MSFANWYQCRVILFANTYGDWATRMKAAARWYVYWVWSLALQNNPLFTHPRVGHWND